MADEASWDADRHLELLTTFHWVAAGLFGLAFLFTSYSIGVELPFVPFFVLPLIALHAASAMGIKERQDWGRILSLITAILSLFSFPIGTAFGVYAIVVHSRADVKQTFQGEPA